MISHGLKLMGLKLSRERKCILLLGTIGQFLVGIEIQLLIFA
jgi:hypothetical protein